MIDLLRGQLAAGGDVTRRRSPFAHLARITATKELAPESEARSRAAQKQREQDELAAFVRDPASSPFAHLAHDQQQVQVTASQIVAAAELARGSSQIIPEPTDPTARAVLRAMAVCEAGGHPLPPLPEGSLAQKIIQAAKKARSNT